MVRSFYPTGRINYNQRDTEMTIPPGFTHTPIPTTPPPNPPAAPAAPATPPSAPPPAVTNVVTEPAHVLSSADAHRMATPVPPGQPPATPPAAPPVAPPAGVSLPMHDMPPELRGKSSGEIMQIYSALRNHYLQSSRGTPQAQPPATPPATPPTPEGADTTFWQDPQAALAKMEERLTAKFAEMMAPTVDSNLDQRVHQTFNAIESQHPGIREMLPEMQGYLQDLSKEQLLSPEVWSRAYRLVLGDRAMRGAPAPTPPAPAAPVATPTPQSWAAPWTPSFVEGPTSPRPAVPTTLTPAELHVAQQMNMTPEMYTAWRGGVTNG